MKTPRDIEIRTERNVPDDKDWWEEELIIGAQWDRETLLDRGHTVAEIERGYDWATGIIARVALRLARLVGQLGATHYRIEDPVISDESPCVAFQFGQRGSIERKGYDAFAGRVLSKILAAEHLADVDSPAGPASSSASSTTSHTATPPAPERIRP